jgi:hypothetical protein
MKQFFVFIYSQYSPASVKCEAIIKSLPPDIKFNYLCVDNKDNRSIIQNDKALDIHVVPCLLIVNTVDGRVTKYEGKKCFDYLTQYKKQQTPLLEPMPMSTYQPPPVAQPQPQQQQRPPPPQQQQQRPPPPQQQQQRPQPPQQSVPPPQQKPIIFDEEDSFSNPPDVNQTSSLLLSENDDDDEPPLPPPVSKKSKQQQQVQQPPPPAKGGKPSLLAQATAMQKSRLMEDEFSTKKNNIN